MILVTDKQDFLRLNGVKPEPLTANKNLRFSKLWIYPASGRDLASEELLANVGDVKIAKTGDGPRVFADTLAPGDTPLKIELPDGQQMLLSSIHVKGAAGDGVFFTYT